VKFRSSIFIPNPIEEVFDFAVDQVGARRWQFQVGVKHLSGEANAPGSTYERTAVDRNQMLVQTYELTIVASPFRFEVRSTSGELRFVYDYTFVVEDEGTRVYVGVDSEADAPAEIENRLTFLRRQLAGDTPGLAAVSSTAPRLLTEIEQARAAELTAIDQARAARNAASRESAQPSVPASPLSVALWVFIPALLIILPNIWLLGGLLSVAGAGYVGILILLLGAAINLGLGGLGLIVLIVAAIANKGKLAAFGGGQLAGPVISFVILMGFWA
jgi:hypothetical protein